MIENIGSLIFILSLIFLAYQCLRPIKQRWISVSEKMPQENQRVLYYFKHVGVHAGVYYGGQEFGGPSGFLNGDVTHWMPLPEPPQ